MVASDWGKQTIKPGKGDRVKLCDEVVGLGRGESGRASRKADVGAETSGQPGRRAFQAEGGGSSVGSGPGALE